MLVKINHNGTTLQFDSQKDDIAILLAPKDKEAIQKMAPDDLLVLSAPLKSMQTRAAEVWQWAMTGWKGATHISHQSILEQSRR